MSALRWITGPFGPFGVYVGGFDSPTAGAESRRADRLGTFHPSRRPIRVSDTRSPGALGLSSLPQFESRGSERG
jgi:hypothetical protein